jgi:hypothetical protein
MSSSLTTRKRQFSGDGDPRPFGNSSLYSVAALCKWGGLWRGTARCSVLTELYTLSPSSEGLLRLVAEGGVYPRISVFVAYSEATRT